jgi:hypothetical protein
LIGKPSFRIHRNDADMRERERASLALGESEAQELPVNACTPSPAGAPLRRRSCSSRQRARW